MYMNGPVAMPRLRRPEELNGESGPSEDFLELQAHLLTACSFSQQLSKLSSAYESKLAQWRGYVTHRQSTTGFTSQPPYDIQSPTLGCDRQASGDPASVHNLECVPVLVDLDVDYLSQPTELTHQPPIVTSQSSSANSALDEAVAEDKNSISSDSVCDLLPLWRSNAAKKPVSPTHAALAGQVAVVENVQKFTDQSTADTKPDNVVCTFMDRYVINPASIKRICWDILSLLFVIYDILTVPLLVFGFDELELASVMRIATMLFWTLDMFLSFFTAYQSDLGRLEMHWRRTALDYLRTRFVFDLVVVLLDWTLFLGDMSSFASILRLGKTFRITRVLRIFRMMRILKMGSLVARIESYSLSTTLFSFLNVVRLVFLIVVINHFFGCGWYGIGCLDDGPLSWIDELEKTDASMLTRYLIAYQWSLSQFTPSSTEYVPANNLERFYALLMLFTGLVLYSAFLGNVTAIVNHARAEASNKMLQGSMLRNFLTDNDVSGELAHAITLFLKGNRVAMQKTYESEVVLIQQLPRHLREELHYEVYSPVLCKHRIFQVVDDHLRSCLMQICHSAVHEKSLERGIEPFHYSKTGTCMYFPISTTLHYFAGPDEGHLFVATPAIIELGGWTTEAPLWMQWQHRGLLSAHEQCDVVELPSYKFCKVVAHHGLALPALRHYVNVFATRTMQAITDGVNIDDLWGTPSGSSHVRLELTSEFQDIENLLKESSD
jgi:hypothetical protein